VNAVSAVTGLGPWVPYVRRVPGDGMVLLCFPHAGGAASVYRGWTNELAGRGIEVWPVQLPGRESRFSEPLTTDLAAVTSTLADLVHENLAGRPYAVYGHSAGAMLAYRFSLTAVTGGRPGPCHVFLGACRPPSRPDPDYPLHRLDHDRFLARLSGYGRIPAEVLRYPDMVTAMLATARADLELVEAPPWSPDMLVHCGVTAVGGVADAAVPADTLPYWREITTGAGDYVVLPGGHFPSPSAEQQLLEVISRGLY
jgi:medium-chain acyl-[acyl-carrier-protein] hydrolase